MVRDEGDVGRLEALFAAFLAESDSGSRADFERFLEAHPEDADELEALHDEWRGFAGHLDEFLRTKGAGERAVPLSFAVHAHGRYRDGFEFARGGMGAIFKTFDEVLERTVAMKVALHGDKATDAARLRRFEREAKLTGRLEHPGIIPIYDVGSTDAAQPFFTMKLVDGRTLQEVLDEGAPGWTKPRILDVLLRVCDAIAYAQDRGVVHRDLKPSNVMVGRYGEAYVVDWGLAREVGSDAEANGGGLSDEDSPLDRTREGEVIGTPVYMAPEQARGENRSVGAASDVYAWGAMLYRVLTGIAPFEDRLRDVEADQRLEIIASEPPTAITELAPRTPSELVAICEKAMSREPSERYASLAEAATDVRSFLDGRVVKTYESGVWAEVKKWVLRNKVSTALAAAVVLAIGAGWYGSSVVRAQAREEFTRSRVAAGAEAKVDKAGQAAASGSWALVIDLLDQARDEERVETLADRLLRARALVAMSREEEARQILDGLLDAGHQVARLELQRAELALLLWEDQVGALEGLQRALAGGLEPADAAFARGLVAGSTPEALVHFENALALDAGHQGARKYAMLLHLIARRSDEVRRHGAAYGVRYPLDPAGLVFEGLADVVEGDLEGALARLEASDTSSDLAAARSALFAFDLITSSLSAAFDPGKNFIQKLKALKPVRQFDAELVKLGETSGHEASLADLRRALPNLPCLTRATAAFGAAFPSFLVRPKLDRLQARLEEFVALHPDGVGFYLLGLVEEQRRPRDNRNATRAALEHYRAGMHTPSILQGPVNSSRLRALEMSYQLSILDPPEPSSKEEFAALIRSVPGTEGITETEYQKFIHAARMHSMFDTARRLQLEYADVHPEPAWRKVMTRIEIERDAGNPIEVIRCVDGYLEEVGDFDPENELHTSLRHHREQAVTALLKLVAELERAEDED